MMWQNIIRESKKTDCLHLRNPWNRNLRSNEFSFQCRTVCLNSAKPRLAVSSVQSVCLPPCSLWGICRHSADCRSQIGSPLPTVRLHWLYSCLRPSLFLHLGFLGYFEICVTRQIGPLSLLVLVLVLTHIDCIQAFSAAQSNRCSFWDKFDPEWLFQSFYKHLIAVILQHSKWPRFHQSR